MDDFLYEYCPHCGDVVKTEIKNGDRDSAKVAAKFSMNLHLGICRENPNAEPNELRDWVNKSLGLDED